MHKRRNGSLAVCYQCRNGNHAMCSGEDEILSESYYCHCSCQPECTRPQCRVSGKRAPFRSKSWAPDDPRWQ